MLKRILGKSDFLKNVTTLVTGTVLAQLIPILLEPFLSRIYTPEEFGTLSIYLSIIGMFAPAANLKYEGAIVLPESDKNASALVAGNMLFSLGFSLFFFLVFLIFGNIIIEKFHFKSEMKIWLLLTPLSIFIISCSRALNYWLIRKKAFRASSINKLIRRSSEGAVQIGTGNLVNFQGLIIGNFLGELFNLIVSYKQSISNKLFLKGVTFRDIRTQLKRYKDFPLYSFIPSFMNSISLFLPAIIVNEFYTLELTGQFGKSRLLLSVPLAFISIAIAQVLTQKIAESSREKKPITPIVIKITFILGILSILGILIMQFFGVELFKWVLGEKWETAGRLSQILVFSFAIKFVVSPLTAIFTALEKVKISSIWQIGYFIAICALYLLKDLTIEDFLLYYIVIDLVAYAIYYLLLFGVCRNYEKQITYV